jgi:hypothetical protein
MFYFSDAMLRSFYDNNRFLSVREKMLYFWDFNDINSMKKNTFPHTITAIEIIQGKDICLIGFEEGYFTILEPDKPKDYRIRKSGNCKELKSN